MSILCKLFGHKLPTGWCGGLPYLDTHYETTDGLGAEHHYLSAECGRCGSKFKVGKIHAPKRMREERMEKRVPILEHNISELRDCLENTYRTIDAGDYEETEEYHNPFLCIPYEEGVTACREAERVLELTKP